MDDWLAVVRRDFDGGVTAACGCSADEQRQLETLALHLARHVHHLIERRRDQAAEANHIYLVRLGAFENLFAGDHHPHVDHLVVVAGEDDADDVLADVVNITLHGCEQDFSLGLHHFASRSHRGLLGFHEWRQVRHGLLHHAGRLDHLGQEHLAGSEQVAHHAHAGHQRAFDDQQRAAQLDARFLGVDLDIGVDAFDEGVGEPLLDRTAAPLLGLLLGRDGAGAFGLQLLAEVDQALGGIRAAVE